MDHKKVIGGIILSVIALGILGWAGLASRKGEAPQTVQASPADKWHVATGKSPMDDLKTVVLSLDSEDLVEGPLGAVRPSLVVRCQEKSTDVYVVTGMAANIETEPDGTPSDTRKVRIRLDDGPATDYYSWKESADRKALFAAETVSGGNDFDERTWQHHPVSEFAQQLAGARKMAFQFTPFDGSPQVARFDLSGLDTRLHQVGEACEW